MQRRLFPIKLDAECFFNQTDAFSDAPQIEQCGCCGRWSLRATVHIEGGLIGPIYAVGHPVPVFDQVCEICHNYLSRLDTLTALKLAKTLKRGAK